jgi:RNA polymerase subunit RPABC4/transcription elongation factor Spt4
MNTLKISKRQARALLARMGSIVEEQQKLNAACEFPRERTLSSAWCGLVGTLEYFAETTAAPALCLLEKMDKKCPKCGLIIADGRCAYCESASTRALGRQAS